MNVFKSTTNEYLSGKKNKTKMRPLYMYEMVSVLCECHEIIIFDSKEENDSKIDSG
jgi:hypothetical protein